MKLLPILLLSLLLLSCNTYSEKELEEFDQQIQDYITQLGVNFERTEEGLYYHIINSGEGEETINYNDEVTFFYTGNFLDGNTFQSIDENEVISYKVNQLIVGWQDALMLLKKGGEIEIILPPQLAYGDKNTGIIPKNSCLYYRLTITDVQ